MRKKYYLLTVLILVSAFVVAGVQQFQSTVNAEPQLKDTLEVVSVSLEDIPFYMWDGYGADAQKTGETEFAWVIGEPTGQPYGDPSVNAFADLSAYDKLIIVASDGTPRIMMNRDQAEGQFSGTETESHLIEYPKCKGTWAEKYFTTEAGEVEGHTIYTVDLKQIVKDKGFAHLHAIKGANWQYVTVLSMTVKKNEGQEEPQSQDEPQPNVFSVREKPTLANSSVAYELDNEVYLFNVGAGMLFAAGNDYQTRASVAEDGQLVYFTATDAALEWGDNVVELKNYVAKFSRYMSAFADGIASVWTDNDNNANRFWTVTKAGDYYRISNVQFGDSMFLGWDAAKKDTRLYLLDAAQNDAFVDWLLISPNDYVAYKNALQVYLVAEELRAAIEKSIGMNINTADAEAVYANEASTIEELTVAINELKDAWLENVSARNPIDVTERYIINPSYENNNSEGWSGTRPGFQTYQNAEFYDKNFDCYQEITGLQSGVYSLGLQGYYRPGYATVAYDSWIQGVNQNAKLYVEADSVREETPLMNIFDDSSLEKLSTNNETSVSGRYIPNDMASAKEYFNAGRYQNILFFEATEYGYVKIGLNKWEKLSSDWTMFDNWTLTYYGAAEDAYQVWAEKIAAMAPTFENAIVTASVLNNYLALRNAPFANNKAEIEAYIQQLNDAKEAVQKNMSLWVKYEEKIVEAQNLISQLKEKGKTSSQEYEDLNDYATGSFSAGEYGDEYAPNGSASYILNAHVLDNAMLKAEIAYLNKLMDDAKYLAPIEGEDVTCYLTNADFSEGQSGWNGWGSATTGGNKGRMPTTGGSPNICAEAYDANNFDLYQEITGDNIPVGVYEISVQGFTRIARNDGNPLGLAWQQFRETDGKQKMPVYVYFNDNTTNFKDIHEEPQTRDFYSDTTMGYSFAENFANGYSVIDVDALSNECYYNQFDCDEQLCFPNTMTGASYAFDKNIYVNSAFGAVTNAGDAIRVGIKGSTNGANWSIFDNFKLTFWGTQADKVLIALQEGIKDVEALNAGRVGKNVVERMSNALADARTATEMQQEDGEAMFATLGELYAAKAAVQASQELMDMLAAANDSLQYAVSAANLYNLLKNANSFRQDNASRLNNNDINDDEVPELLNQIRQWMKDIEKFVKLQEWADKLNAAAPYEEEIDYGLVSTSWLSNFETLAAELDIMLNPENDDEAVKVEQVDGLIEQIKMMLDTKYLPANINDATASNPIDLTKMIKNPRFENYANDWTYTSGYEGLSVEVFGYWNRYFNVYQTLTGLPEGYYEIRNQAFYRSGSAEEDAEYFFNGNTESNAKLYAWTENYSNLTEQSIKLLASGALDEIPVQTVTIYDEETGIVMDSVVYADGYRPIYYYNPETGEEVEKYVPNNMSTAAECFTEGRYPNSLRVYVGADGILQFGMKNDYSVYNDWCLMDNFQLFYYGKDGQNPHVNDDVNYMYANSEQHFVQGEACQLAISMQNKQVVTAFQFDIVLPQGMSVATVWNEDSEEVLDLGYTGRAKSTHVIAGEYQNDGSLRVIGYSSSNATYRYYNGELLNIGIYVPDWYSEGNYRVTLKNVLITNVDGEENHASDVTFYITVGSIKGDANNDRQVTMSDVVAMVNNVLTRPSNNFNKHNADINGDGNITMGDVVGVVNIVLGRNVAGSRSFADAEEMLPGTLSLKSEADHMSVMLDNNVAYTAFQMDVTLPAGMNLENVLYTGRQTLTHSLSMSQLENGKVRIVGWSANNADLKGNTGELLSFELSGAQTTGVVTIDNIRFAMATGAEHQLAAVETFGQTTGIAELKSDKVPANAYDLQGRRVEKAKKGTILVVKGQKKVK